MGIIVVDGNNVMGAVPDGWWRDRPAAVRRLHRRLVAYRSACGEHRLVMVLDVPQADLPAGDNDGIEILYPPRSGRDAADWEIVRFLDGLNPDSPPVTVVTSDRALAAAVADRGATVVGARTFLGQMDAATGG